MRIISGSLKGRRFSPSGNLNVRPTTDFAKESLFNIINNNFDYEDLKVLDLFSGTGNISFEFVSRGSISVTSVDSNFKCIEFIKKTCEEYNITNLHAVKTNVFNYLKFITTPFDMIFADPPYDMEGTETIPDIIFGKNLLNKGGWLIIEHSRSANFENHPNLVQHRMYGKVNFSFFQVKE